MGTFTLATGLGMLFTGILAMAIGGTVALYIINKHVKSNKEDDE
tara:strand:- start:16 stop:147 length:132 start_codon:yes stop_codon:yes gene_type:complete